MRLAQLRVLQGAADQLRVGVTEQTRQLGPLRAQRGKKPLRPGGVEAARAGRLRYVGCPGCRDSGFSFYSAQQESRSRSRRKPWAQSFSPSPMEG